MMVRNLLESDLDNLKLIHRKYYADQFEFPEFHKFVLTFVIENDEKIITAGGLRLIPESIVLTDKSKTIKDKRSALLLALEAQCYFADKAGFDGLHAFIQDTIWFRQLTKHGFKHTKGRSLVMEI